MKLSTLGRSMGWVAVLLALAAQVQAQDLQVVETSELDRVAADKLSELIPEPFTRVHDAGGVLRDQPAELCHTREQIILILDVASQAVRLLRCRDATALTRTIDPDAARETPYLAAFIATELLSLNSELEDVRVEPLAAPARPPPPSPNEPPLPAVVETDRSSRLLRLRVGAEAILYGPPFGGVPHPTLAVGVSFAREPEAVAWLFEIQLSAFAKGQQQTDAERISLTRHDGRVRVGVQWPLGPFALSGLLHLRGSLTQGAYSGRSGSSQSSLRLGLGAGVQGDLALASWIALYADAVADAATSRSDYRVGGVSRLRDPELIFSFSLGFVVRARL